MKKYTVIRDTREHNDKGWLFDTSARCDGTSTSKLDTGDYSIEGLEDIFCIERKGSVSEFARNVTENRFERELERLESFKYPFIILEFEMSDIIDYPKNSGIPYRQRNQLRFKGPFILKRLLEFQMKYKTKILLCGRRGKEVASSIFKRVLEIELG
jgi:ERCC4-type nuclease|tara:strand:- start:414 stop:881 length:468 start_codon:yes stop_codon:yes gene_type:complete